MLHEFSITEGYISLSFVNKELSNDILAILPQPNGTFLVNDHFATYELKDKFPPQDEYYGGRNDYELLGFEVTFLLVHFFPSQGQNSSETGHRRPF